VSDACMQRWRVLQVGARHTSADGACRWSTGGGGGVDGSGDDDGDDDIV
jgi:hypothetical protein